MKSERGITLTSLVIYIIVATVVIAMMALISTYFTTNMQNVKDQDQYALEFNKFNMFFVNDVKSNKTAQIQPTRIVFEDGTFYEYSSGEKAVYRNNEIIAKEIKELVFTKDTYTVNKTEKTIVKVRMNIGATHSLERTIEYVLKYW
ncbi:MAG: hypothetical protein HFJ28_05700 [Clostridia bacterium]|jgi:hypothetical protein|nr:hypothetical protein [Clostridia bacterium]